MANHRIWAPWRLNYVKDAGKDRAEECIFCAKPAESDDQANLIVHRGELAFVILNLFPYTNGHLMVAPYEHTSRFQDLSPAAVAEITDLSQQAMRILEEEYRPHGFNLGLNQGRVAGAGVEHHIHLHVVPRWGGDTNFMPVTADTRVMPQTLDDTFAALNGRFRGQAAPEPGGSQGQSISDLSGPGGNKGSTRDQAAPGRGSRDPSISDSSGPGESRGGGDAAPGRGSPERSVSDSSVPGGSRGGS